MNTRTDHGFLVLADVSGFTAFVTSTELEHGSAIIAALLDEVVARLSPPLEIQEIEGDAVFALAGEDGQAARARLFEVLENAFAAFKETGDVFDPQTAERLKTFIYSAGNLRAPDEAYRAFRGRDPDPKALMVKRGLTEVASQ